jgi:hypothetical protein
MTRVLSVLLLLGALASAQTSTAADNSGKAAAVPQTQDQTQFTQEFGFWSGYSPTSTIAIGVTNDRRLFTFNGKYSIVVLNSKHTSLRWVSEVVPIAVLHQPTSPSQGAAIRRHSRGHALFQR